MRDYISTAIIIAIILAVVAIYILLIDAFSPTAEQSEQRRYQGCVYTMATTTDRSVEEIQNLCR